MKTVLHATALNLRETKTFLAMFFVELNVT
jgi:hypothetical protein